VIDSSTKRATLFRVQAADGRGPWRPGLSQYWVDHDSDQRMPPPVQDAFGLEWRKRIPRGWHCGCACRTLDKLLAWFTPVERQRLEVMGYRPVVILADKIIEENADQVIFARRDPLNVAVIPIAWRIEVAA
jgi:hypothetical protein